MNKMELAIQIPSWRIIGIVILTSVVLSLVSFIIIRFSGKKSISQMTLPQLVIMISMGSVITKPLNDNKTMIGAIISIFIFVGVMILLEYISLKSDKIEPLLDSTPALLIMDGEIQVDNLKDIRMTIDQLESMLRQNGISCFKKLRTCTLEIDGQIGYEEMKNYNPNEKNIFDEIRQGKHNYPVEPKLD